MFPKDREDEEQQAEYYSEITLTINYGSVEGSTTTRGGNMEFKEFVFLEIKDFIAALHHRV